MKGLCHCLRDHGRQAVPVAGWRGEVEKSECPRAEGTEQGGGGFNDLGGGSPFINPRYHGPMRATLLIASTMLLLSCANIQQQKAQPPATDDLQFHNLQVLPPNISRDQLINAMKRFTQALGVGCDYCHAPAPVAVPGAAEPELDFPSDAKPTKLAARTMIRMTHQINDDYVSTIPDAHTVVTCWTCHRGEAQPAVVPSLPAPAN